MSLAWEPICPSHRCTLNVPAGTEVEPWYDNGEAMYPPLVLKCLVGGELLGETEFEWVDFGTLTPEAL